MAIVNDHQLVPLQQWVWQYLLYQHTISHHVDFGGNLTLKPNVKANTLNFIVS